MWSVVWGVECFACVVVGVCGVLVHAVGVCGL